MDFCNYSIEIQELISTIRNKRKQNPKGAISYCKKLVDQAKQKQDTFLCSYAYFYTAEIYFCINNYKLFMQYLIKGLSYQQESHLHDLLARSYNLLAICADSHGNLVSALDYYFTALTYCKEGKLKYESGLVYTNIGHLYISLTDYRTATKYLRIGLDCFKGHENEFFGIINIGLIQIALGNCYYNLGNLARANKYILKFKNCFKENSPEERYCYVSFSTLYVKILTASNQIEEREQLLSEMIPIILTTDSLLDLYYEIFDFCEHLILIKKYEVLWKIISRLDSLQDPSSVTNLHLRILKFKLKYYEALNDRENYTNACEQYFQLSQNIELDEKSLTLTTLNLHFSLQEVRSRQLIVEQENRVLQERSEHDALTGLPNRYRLNEYSDETFEHAYLEQQSLAVEIFDVDCFKAYNDTYGHQMGDNCLCLIASLLKEIMCENIFCARYGGDEFVIIYTNMTDEEVLRIATKLKEDVIALNIPNENSSVLPYVTISQGIRNSIPYSSNKLWDYLFGADAALYQVKKETKNDICLVHKTITKKNAASMIEYTNN